MGLIAKDKSIFLISAGLALVPFLWVRGTYTASPFAAEKLTPTMWDLCSSRAAYFSLWYFSSGAVSKSKARIVFSEMYLRT